MNTLISNPENSSQYYELPNKKKVIAEAVEKIINPVSYLVQDGDTVTRVAENLGIIAPPSLFNVQSGQIWQVAHGFMYNPRTGTSFPIRSANEDYFTLAA